MRFELVLFFSGFLLCAFAGMAQAEEQKLIVIRHGEAESNVLNIYNSNPEDPSYRPMDMTPKGKEQIQKTARELLAKGFNNNNIVAVYVSPFPRAQQSAEQLVNAGLVSKDKLITDKRLGETLAGDLDGKPSLPEWTSAIAQAHHGETLEQIRERVQNFYQTIAKKYPKGNVIVITHALAGQSLIDLVGHKKVKLSLGEAQIIPLK